jgi:hypothetical protein
MTKYKRWTADFGFGSDTAKNELAEASVARFGVEADDALHHIFRLLK